MRYKIGLLCTVFLFQSLWGADRIVIGIAGGTGSGKSTLAKHIKDYFKSYCVLVNQDAYYRDLSSLSPEERDLVNFDHPQAIDFELLYEHLDELKNGKKVQIPIYNFRSHTREFQTIPLEPAQIILVEGILIFSIPKIRNLFDLKIFLDIDDDVRLSRRVERDIKERSRDLSSVLNQYLTTVKPMHDSFVAPSKNYADILVPHGGDNETALAMIISRLKEQLEQCRLKG